LSNDGEQKYNVGENKVKRDRSTDGSRMETCEIKATEKSIRRLIFMSMAADGREEELVCLSCWPARRLLTATSLLFILFAYLCVCARAAQASPPPVVVVDVRGSWLGPAKSRWPAACSRGSSSRKIALAQRTQQTQDSSLSETDARE
jgi:hypothetical protein